MVRSREIACLCTLRSSKGIGGSLHKAGTFFSGKAEGFDNQISWPYCVISHTSAPPATQPLPGSSRMLHTLLGLQLQAQKTTITQQNQSYVGELGPDASPRETCGKKKLKVTSACPPVSHRPISYFMLFPYQKEHFPSPPTSY